MGSLYFGLFVAELRLTAKGPISFGEYDAANWVRGMWGKSLHGSPLYERLFAPARREAGPSGLKDPPRPFVLRTRGLAGRSFAAGEEIPFGAHVFDREWSEGERVVLDLTPRLSRVSRVKVELLTPTELKGGEGFEFGVLLARLRDRVSGLRELYGEGPLGIDFREMGERARAVRLVEARLLDVDVERVSRRTGQRHGIGGMVGELVYEGELGEFVPYLEAGFWTGVGRQTVWGKGEMRTTVLA